MVKNYVYIIQCNDATLYTGWTNDLQKRMKAHQEGKGAKYTKCRRPVQLLYYESFPTKQEAMSREWHMKRLTRKEKEKLIDSLDEKGVMTVQEINDFILPKENPKNAQEKQV